MSLNILLLCKFFGMILVVSSKKWFIMWLGYEISMFSLMPYLKKKKTKSMELYYFIMQMFGTLLLLWGMSLKNFSIISMMGLFLKMGFFPLFWWVPSIVQNLSWMSIFVLTIMNKIPSMVIIQWLDFNEQNIIWVCLFTITMSMIGMYNTNYSLKLIFGWSSVMNTSLMMLLMILKNFFLVTIFFFFYFVISFYCCYKFSFKNNNFYSKMFSKKKTTQGMIGLFFFSGIPNLGFLYKIMMFSGLSKWKVEWIMSLCVMMKIFFQVIIYVKLFNNYYFLIEKKKIVNVIFFAPFLGFVIFPFLLVMKS